MKILVFSRQDATQNSYVINENCVMISIRNIKSEPPMFAVNSHIQDILSLVFDDEENQTIGMNYIQANLISKFVDKWKDKVDLIIVHCEAGVSRSAGVAAAIGKYLNNDDTFIFKNRRYVPNMNCYRLTLNALYNN